METATFFDPRSTFVAVRKSQVHESSRHARGTALAEGGAMRTLIVCLCLAACGGDNGPSADQACADVAQARCNLRSMCTSGVGVTRNYGDMNTCIAREKVNCLDGLGAPSGRTL